MGTESKLYRTHGACRRWQGQAWPVHVGDGMMWAGATVFERGKLVARSAFAVAALQDHRKFDRIFQLSRHDKTWWLRTILARDYDGQWPQLGVFFDKQSARDTFAEIVGRYRNNANWVEVS